MHALSDAISSAQPSPDESAELPAAGGRHASDAAELKLQLLVVGPWGRSTVVLPERGEVTIGRAAECDVHVDDTKLSRRHGTLRVDPEQIAYTDLRSLNGSFVHETRLVAGVPMELSPGDSVQVGDTVLVLLRGSPFEEADCAGALETARALSETEGAHRVVGAGALDRMNGVVDRVANGLINVLILGETGVGKDVLACRIHARSPRAERRLVSINCAALSESLLESELFGHERGAFTGAIARKVGLLESAHGGTVFLDEIGEIPPATQAKLLRVLEQREVVRVGAVRPCPIDVRFLAATNRNLEDDVAAGRFRADLFFRINGITLSLPPLRERTDEIEPLARAFVRDASARMGLMQPPRLSSEALDLLRRHTWPGNIRELRNAMERAVLLCGDEPEIAAPHLPLDPPLPTAPPAARWPRADGSTTLPPPASSSSPEGDRARVVQALERCAWNQANAAKLLGVSRGTLIKRIVAYGLPRPRKRS